MALLSLETPWRTLSGNIAQAEFNFIDRFGCYPRLFFEDRTFTNQEELAHAGRLAKILMDRGVQAGDRVLALLPNSPDLTAAFQAAWMIGAIMVPIMPTWTADVIVDVLASAEPSCVITFPIVASRIRAGIMAAGLNAKLLCVGETDAPQAENIIPVLSSVKPLETPADRSDSDLSLLLYTSGTTAAPRAAMITHGNLRAAFDSMSSLNADLPRGPMLHSLPIPHSFGLLMLMLANGWGWSTVLLRQFDPTRALERIERYHVQYLPVVPTMLIYLLQQPELARYNLSSVRRIISGGAALPEQLRLRFQRVCGGRVEQGYGLSETVAVVTAYGEKDVYRTGSAGRPSPGVRVAILDEKSNILSPKITGEIAVAGPHVMTGYWRDAKATAETFVGEWLRTGDMGSLDEDGFLYITDRKKEVIIKGGENVSPLEVEEVLHMHPAVAAAAAVAIPDMLFGENVCAVLQLKPGARATEAEIREFAILHLGKFKAPSRVLFWPELPRNFTGKIWKRAIRSRLEGTATS